MHYLTTIYQISIFIFYLFFLCLAFGWRKSEFLTLSVWAWFSLLKCKMNMVFKRLTLAIVISHQKIRNDDFYSFLFSAMTFFSEGNWPPLLQSPKGLELSRINSHAETDLDREDKFVLKVFRTC